MEDEFNKIVEQFAKYKLYPVGGTTCTGRNSSKNNQVCLSACFTNESRYGPEYNAIIQIPKNHSVEPKIVFDKLVDKKSIIRFDYSPMKKRWHAHYNGDKKYFSQEEYNEWQEWPQVLDKVIND